jgi:membrane protein implicated in regulation of membrane protease activity|tara:strand:+ start:221 stop:565 length:345 start_codon:yes stop_codon:yes gene_type:complete
MDWAFNNLAESLFILGIFLLVIEVAVLGFSTFVLFFVGCGAVITAGLLYVDTTPAKGDLVGHNFVLVEDVAPELAPEYHYSGINWKLKASEHLVAGTQVEVIQADVGVFHIKAS